MMSDVRAYEYDLLNQDLIRLNHEFQQILMSQQETIVKQQKTIEQLEESVDDYRKLLFHEKSVISGQESDK